MATSQVATCLLRSTLNPFGRLHRPWFHGHLGWRPGAGGSQTSSLQLFTSGAALSIWNLDSASFHLLSAGFPLNCFGFQHTKVEKYFLKWSWQKLQNIWQTRCLQTKTGTSTQRNWQPFATEQCRMSLGKTVRVKTITLKKQDQKKKSTKQQQHTHTHTNSHS